MPRLMAAEPEKIKRAAAKTLTSLAFDSIPEIVERAKTQLSFSLNARRALGLHVSQKARPDNLVAIVQTNRGWLYYHLETGERSAINGFRWKGRRYLVYPLDKKFVTRRGRIYKRYLKRSFVLPTRYGALLAHRPKGEQIEPIAILSLKFKHKKVLAPEKVINELIEQKGTRLFRLFLAKQKARR